MEKKKKRENDCLHFLIFFSGGATTHYIYYFFKLLSPYSFSIRSPYSYENIVTNLVTSFYYKLFLCNIVEYPFFKHFIIMGNTDVSLSSFDVLYFIITILSFVNISYYVIFTHHHISPCFSHFILSILFITLP